jgi:hypothetical protein
VVKNTLTERAADKAGAEPLKELLEGPTALTFVRGDAAAAAKALSDYARETDLLPFKGGYMDGSPLTAAEISAAEAEAPAAETPAEAPDEGGDQDAEPASTPEPEQPDQAEGEDRPAETS